MYPAFSGPFLRRTRNTGRAASTSLIGAVAAALFLLSSFWAPVEAQSLRGSPRSLDVQNQMARRHDFSYIATTSQVERFIAAGYLVPVRGNRDFRVHDGVSFPYAREAVRTFLQRLGRQYRNACGEQLVVTSLTRPLSRQPRNASSESVHPTGMAVDLRRSKRSQCRAWLERTLLALERQGVLEATREYWPPHYHIAVFPEPYRQYVADLDSRQEAPSDGGPAGLYQVRAGPLGDRPFRGHSGRRSPGCQQALFRPHPPRATPPDSRV